MFEIVSLTRTVFLLTLKKNSRRSAGRSVFTVVLKFDELMVSIPAPFLMFCSTLSLAGAGSPKKGAPAFSGVAAPAAYTCPAPWSTDVAVGTVPARAEPTIADRISSGVADGLTL